jgi:transmembrane sensor
MTTGKEQRSAAEWIVRLRDHEELTHSEKMALTDFMRESPTNVREMLEHTFIDEDLKALTIPQSDLDRWTVAARSAAAGALAFPGKQMPASSRERGGDGSDAFHRDGWRAQLPRTVPGLRILVAASLAAMLAIGGVLLHSRVGLYTTGFGEQRVLTLADGSVVTLNTESQIKVDFSAKERLIELRTGEAFFRVAHDASRPFFVDAKDAIVRAVGTQFNVRIAPQNTVVSVVDGVVKVSLNKDFSSAVSRLRPSMRESSSDGGEGSQTISSASGEVPSGARTQREGRQVPPDESQITLTKGEEARVERQELTSGTAVPPISKAETPAAVHAAAWTQGRLEFEGTPLAEVLSEFQRYQQFDVEIEDDTTRQLKLTGSFESHDPDSVLAYIATIPGIVVERKEQRTYLIRRR